jgi:hypothetical protein
VFNKNIRRNATYILLVSLSLHILVIHGMFNSSVICFEDNGTTSVEYTFDGASCATHNYAFSNEHRLIEDDKINECEDLSLTELHNSDDQFLIKKSNNIFVKNQSIIAVSFSTSAIKLLQITNNVPTLNSTASLTHFKTVSLLI